MAYQSLYRKYRPQTFADVMGQGHVVRTLQNALASGRIAHGYLFTGTRGTAKTTVARLLAKALNCESANHAVGEPCNHCEACRSITAGTCIDVIEMDAASHRGVADIEEVRKAVGYGPMQFRYKVFIIDEAHQLSSDAKDAFLKTLEEPPANVVFVLATTEPQAIPITIRSRCQQFDFKRGSLAEITARLQYVLDCEGVTYTRESITLVARGAEGSYRDSLSLLEQVLAFAPNHITATEVETVLGSLDAEMLARVVHAVAQRNAPETFALAGQILDSGKEARTLLRTLSLHFRDLMLVSVGGPAVSAEMTPDEVQRLQYEARLFTPPQMLKAMDVLNEAQGETRWNNQHRLLTELTFLKLMNLGGDPASAQEFLTAPIVFTAAPTNGVAAPPVARAPQVITPPPAPVAVSAPPPVVVQEALPPPAPVSGGEESVLSSSGNDEVPADFFADETPADEDGIEYEPDDTDDESFAPITDDDAPLLDGETPSLATVMAAAVTAAPVAPTPAMPVEVEDASAAAPEWELFSPEPQPGPGLFEDIEPVAAPPVVAVVAVVATPEPAKAAPLSEPPEPVPNPPTPSANGEGESEPLFPTRREGSPQPPAPSLASVEETHRPLPSAAATSDSTSATEPPEPEPEDNEPLVSLGQVRQAWPTFMRQAERLSRLTWMSLRDAAPTQIAGRQVVITVNNRAYYEMLMEKPKAQAFIRKLLARVLGREGIGLRLELDPTQAVPPKRAKGTESREPKKRYDRFAAIDALDVNGGPGTAPAVPAGGGFGGGSLGWSSGTTATREAPAAPPKSAFGNFGVSAAPRERSEESAPATREWAKPTAASFVPSESGGSDKRAVALAEPLVQEVLMVFGGDIVVD